MNPSPVSHRIRRVAAAIFALVVLGPLLAGPTGAAAAPGEGELTVGPVRTIWNPTGFASFPSLYDASTTNADGSRDSRLMISYGTSNDVFGNATVLIESGDDGETWAERAICDRETTPCRTAGVVNAVRLADAAHTVVTVDYEPLVNSGAPEDPDPSTPINEGNLWFRRWHVTDQGWQQQSPAKTDLWPGIAWLRFQRGLLLLSDARTMVGTVYGADATGNFVALVRSADGGATWTSGGVLARGATFSEANLSFTADDRLMVWMRRDVQHDWTPDLYYSHSTTADGSGTWSTPVRFDGDTGNSPGSMLLGNGTALQGSGRPGNVLRAKYSGESGADGWVDTINVYDNRPTAGRGLGGRPLAISGSSATIGLAPLTADTALVIGDNCAANWGCPASATGYPYGNDHVLWALTAKVDPGRPSLDLAALFRQGRLRVLGDEALTTYGLAGSPRQSLLAYAFDGDVRNDSSVVTADRSIALDLGDEYVIGGIGAIARLRGARDLTIQTSVDGETWQTPTRRPREGSVRPFRTPVSARYVRLSDPNTGGSAQAFLNELQVYTADR